MTSYYYRANSFDLKDSLKTSETGSVDHALGTIYTNWDFPLGLGIILLNTM